MVTVIIMTGVLVWFIAAWLLTGHTGRALFFRATFVGVLSWAIVIAIMFAIAGVRAETVAGAATVALTVAVVVAVVGGVAVAGMVAGAGVVAGTGVVAIAGVGAGVGAGVAVLIVAPAAELGVLIRTVLIRTAASLRYLVPGFKSLPSNWWRLLFCTDFQISPTLVPGTNHILRDFSARAFIGLIRSGDDPFSRILGLVSLPIFYIPALAYRYSIKSTCWLYLPLIYLVTLPGKLHKPETRAKWLQAFSTKAYNWAYLLLALLTLLIAFAAFINPTALAALLGQNIPVSAFSIWFVLDFADIRPWQYFTLPNAVLVVLLFFWIDGTGKDLRANMPVDVMGWKVATILKLTRLRGLLVIIWLTIAAASAIQFLHACGNLAASLDAPVTWLFSRLPWLGTPECVGWLAQISPPT